MSFANIITIILFAALILLIVKLVITHQKQEKLLCFHLSSLVLMPLILLNSTLELKITLDIIITLLLANLITIFYLRK